MPYVTIWIEQSGHHFDAPLHLQMIRSICFMLLAGEWFRPHFLFLLFLKRERYCSVTARILKQKQTQIQKPYGYSKTLHLGALRTKLPKRLP